jgi:carboxy-cis,cis-muconate cyclase
VTLSLKLTNNITTSHTHNWLALSHDKKNIYGAGDGGWTSYLVISPTTLGNESFVNMTGDCSSIISGGNRGIFVLGSTKPPYAVYGDEFGRCTNVIAVDGSGAVTSVVQNISHYSNSGVHGTAFDLDEEYLYSADDKANSIGRTSGIPPQVC